MKKVIKKKLVLALLSLGVISLSLSSCDSSSDNPSSSETVYQSEISGYAEKGIFRKGDTVNVHVYSDSTFTKLVKTFVTTLGDSGAYKVTGNITGRYVKVVVKGFYFDETDADNGLLDGEVSALIDAKETKQVNLNILTDLQADIASGLIVAKGFKAAKDSALKSLLGIVGDAVPNETKLAIITKGAGKLRLSDDGGNLNSAEGDILLKFSAAILSAAKSQNQSPKDFIAAVVKPTLRNPASAAQLASSISSAISAITPEKLVGLKAIVRSVRAGVPLSGIDFARRALVVKSLSVAPTKDDTVVLRFKPRNTTNKKFTFSSTNTAIFTVKRQDSFLIVKGVAKGDAKINVVVGNVATPFQFDVNVAAQ